MAKTKKLNKSQQKKQQKFILNKFRKLIFISLSCVLVVSVYAAIETNIWDFNLALNYTFGATVEVTGGQAQLKATSSTIADDTEAEFNTGTYTKTKFDTDHLALGDGEITPNAHTLALYHLNEAAGNAIDSSGNGNDATNNNGADQSIDGKFAKGVDLDGTNQYFAIANDLGDPSAMTLEFWFNKANLNAGTRYLMDSRSNGNWWFLQDYQSGANCPSQANICFNGRVEIPGTMMSNNTWHHVALTSDATATKIYLDGVLVDTGTAFNPDLGADLRIGSRFSTTGFYDGKMDEIAIWDTALDASTIAEHAKNFKASGTYESKIFDATQIAKWSNLAWSETQATYLNWLDTDWDKRQTLTIDNTAVATTFTDYQTKIKIPFNADMQVDFDDLRFTANDGTTELDYWIQSVIASTEAVVWVEIPSVPASSTVDIYMYYDNDTATTTSNGEDTFLFFDNHNDASIDVAKWTETDPNNEISESGGTLDFVRLSNGSWNKGVIAVPSFARGDLSLEADYVWEVNNPAYDALMFGWHDSGAGISYQNIVYAFYNPGSGSADSVAMSIYEDGHSRGGSTGTWDVTQDYDLRVRMRASGGAYYERSIDSGDTWTTNYTSTYSSESNLKPAWSFYAGTHAYDNVRIRKWASTEPTTSFGAIQNQIPTDIQFQIRSCDDVLCDTEIFAGPDGTAATYYTTPAGEAINASLNRYFQYKIYFSGDTLVTPEVDSIEVQSVFYDTTIPSVQPNTSLSPAILTSWTTFIENATKPVGTQIYYQLSDDDGVTWKYWDGAAWANVVGATDYNLDTIINANINTFPPASGQILFKAFLESNGGAQPQLNEIRIDYSGDPNTLNCVQDWVMFPAGDYNFDPLTTEFTATQAQLKDLGGATYSTVLPTVDPISSYNGLNFHSYETFTETSTKPAGSEIYYQLSDDDGVTWKYWDGAAWQNIANGIASDANTIALWHLNNTTGVVEDSSGNANHGTNSGSTRGVAGKFGNAFDLDGVNDSIEIPYDAALNLVGTDFTIDFFLNTADPNAVLVKKYTGAAGGDSWGVRLNAGVLEFYDGTAWLSSGTAVNDSTMHYISITADDTTNTLTFYVDNTQVNTQAFADITANIFSVYIGEELNSQYYDGILDDIRISNKIRTANEQFIYATLVNLASEINTGITSFSTVSNQIKFKSFLKSDGTAQAQLDNIRLTCTHSNNQSPNVTIPAAVTQSTDSSGQISFSVDMSDGDNEDTKLKIEYSDDNGLNWYDPILLSATPSAGTVDLDNALAYQVGSVDPVDTTTGLKSLTIVWDTQSAANQNGTLDIQDLNTIQLRVTANDNTSDSPIRTTASFEVDNLDPSALAGFASPLTTDSTANLTWTAILTENNFNHYEIWYGTTLAQATGKTGTKWDNSNDAGLSALGTNSTTITGLAASTPYFFNIWGIDNFGNEVDGGSTTNTTLAGAGGGGGGGSGGGGGGSGSGGIYFNGGGSSSDSNDDSTSNDTEDINDEDSSDDISETVEDTQEDAITENTDSANATTDDDQLNTHEEQTEDTQTESPEHSSAETQSNSNTVVYDYLPSEEIITPQIPIAQRLQEDYRLLEDNSEEVYKDLLEISNLLSEDNLLRDLGLNSLLEFTTTDKFSSKSLANKIFDLQAANQILLNFKNGHQGPLVHIWYSYGSIQVNIAAVNPTGQSLEINIDETLPKGLTEEAILSDDNLKITYDSKLEKFKIQDTLTLKPTSSLLKQVILKDIWDISSSELTNLRLQLALSKDLYKHTSYAQVVDNFIIASNKTLNLIEAKQEGLLPPLEHIALYHQFESELSSIYTNLDTFDNLKGTLNYDLIFKTVLLLMFLGLMGLALYLVLKYWDETHKLLVASIFLVTIVIGSIYLIPNTFQLNPQHNSETQDFFASPPDFTDQEFNLNGDTELIELEDLNEETITSCQLNIIPTPTGYLNIRQTPSLEGEIIGQASPNESYNFVDKQNNWYKIITPEDADSWVYGDYIEVNEENSVECKFNNRIGQ